VSMPARHAAPTARAELERLVYELLDAHADTARLADRFGGHDVRWAAHLAYLRDLQRVARGILAR